MQGNCQVNYVVYKYDVTRPLPRTCILDLQSENENVTSIAINYQLNIRHIQI